MTSVAFIMGVLPLVFAHGAGAEIRQAMGVAVFSGMLGVTVFGLALTPVFFVVVGALVEWPTRRRAPAAGAAGGRGRGGGLIDDRVLLTGPPCSARICCRQLLTSAARSCGPYTAPAATPVVADAGRRRRRSSRSPTTRAGGVCSRIRCSNVWKHAALDANHDIRQAVARVDQARAIFDDVSLRPLSHGRRRRFGGRARADDSRVHQRADPHPHLSGGPRRVLGDRPLRRRAFGRPARRAPTPRRFEASLEDVRVSVAAEVARNYFELRGAAAAARGGRAQPGEPARGAASDAASGATPGGGGAGRRQRRRQRGGRRGEHSAAARARSRRSATASPC